LKYFYGVKKIKLTPVVYIQLPDGCINIINGAAIANAAKIAAIKPVTK